MRNLIAAVALLAFLSASGYAQTPTITLSGGTLSGSFGAWGGTGKVYSPVFNVDASGGIDITYYDIDMSLLRYISSSWTLKGVAQPGITVGISIPSIDPPPNSIWAVMLNQEIASGNDWNANPISTLGPDGLPFTSDDTRHYGHQDWYRTSTGGKVGGAAADPFYNNESYVTPNPRFPTAPAKTATELNSFDFRLRVLPTGANSYTYEMWVRLHNAASNIEGCGYCACGTFNYAINNCGATGAWRQFANGATTVFPVSGMDLSAAHVYMGLGNFQDPASHSLAWGRIEVTGTLTTPGEVWVNYLWSGSSSLQEVAPDRYYGYNAFDNITSALAAVASGGTVHVANGTYAHNSTLYISKPVTMLGESESGTIIDVSSNTGGGWGLALETGGITMKRFTIIPASASTSGYPLHASSNATPMAVLSGLDLEDITIDGGKKTGFDIHGFDDVTLTNLTTKNAISGNGVQLTGCHNVAMTGITTAGNSWGGSAVYCSGASYLNRACDNVSINAANSALGEANQFYVENTATLTSTNIIATGYDFKVLNSAMPLYAFYNEDVSNAVGLACNLGGGAANSTVTDVVSGDYYVGHYTASYMKIQNAVSAASVGVNIHVFPGTYVENLTWNKRLNLIGAGSGLDEASNTILRKNTANPIISLAASGLSASSPVLFKDLRLEPVEVQGFNLQSDVAYLKLDNVHVIGSSSTSCTENEVGLRVWVSLSLSHLEVVNCAFDKLHYGWYFAKNPNAATPPPDLTSNVSGVDVSGSTFNENGLKGLYAEKLSDAVFTNVTVDGNGTNNGGACALNTWNCGVDINLKNGAYSAIHFIDCEITDNGLGVKEGMGLAVKARSGGDNAAYSPSSLTDVLVTGCTVSGNERGIRFGEPGKSNTGPTGVHVNNNLISGNVKTYSGSDGSAYGGLVNMSLAETDATGNWWGSNNGPADATGTLEMPDNPAATAPQMLNAAPSGQLGDAVTDNVDYYPWNALDLQVAATGNYTSPAGAVNLNFATLPTGGGNISIKRFVSPPYGFPAPPTGAVPGLYLVITSDMPNYSFNVTVTLSDLPAGVAATSSIYYYNTATSAWVAQAGTYADLAPAGHGPEDTFTFTTNHFTPFTILNPGALLPIILTDRYPNDLYDESTIPPATEPWQSWMGNGDLTYDWSWSYLGYQLEVIPLLIPGSPATGANIFAADVVLSIDTTMWKAYESDVTLGGLWGANPTQLFVQRTPGSGSSVLLEMHAAITAAFNPEVVSDAVSSLFRINVSPKAPWPAPITFGDAKLRNKLNQAYALDLSDDGKARIYLGDVVHYTSTPSAAVDSSRGDGYVDVHDLSKWSLPYFRDVSGIASPNPYSAYRLKYDIGPTTTNYVDGLPIPDGKINFEDLVIFAISYGLSAGNVYPKQAVQTAPLNIETGVMAAGPDRRFTIPVRLGGNAVDLKAFSLSIGYDTRELVFEGVRPGVLLPAGNFLKADDADGALTIDGAALNGVISGEGELVLIDFRAQAGAGTGVELTGAMLRDGRNRAIGARTAGAVPSLFSLEQNFPNPFDGSTSIRFGIPQEDQIDLAVFDGLGRRIATLASGAMGAGLYTIQWNGRDGNNVRVPAGVYYVRLSGGASSAQRAMHILK